MESSGSRAGVNPVKHPPGQSNDRNDVSLRFYTNPSVKTDFTVIKLGEKRRFDFTRSTKILIHDLNSNPLEFFPRDVKDLYLEKGHNVIILDWADLAGHDNPSYFPASICLRLNNVASIVNEILENLITDSHLDLSNVHIVGQSVGCRLISIIAKHFKAQGARFGRLTALDPLQHEMAAALSDILYEDDDARFIDAYHRGASTNCQHVAHVDFVVGKMCTGLDGSPDLGDVDICKIFAQTIADGPDHNNVTDEVKWNSRGQNEATTVEMSHHGPIIFGEYCMTGTKGQYKLDYESYKRAAAGSFNENPI